MTRHRSTVAMVLAFAAAPGTGCSWIFVDRPPPEPVPATTQVACTTSVASPVIDTTLAGLALGLGIAGIVAGSHPAPACSGWCFGTGFLTTVNTGTVVAGGVLVASAAPLALSAAYGYSTTAKCRELTDARLACVSGVESSCKRLTVEPQVAANVGVPCVVQEDCKGGTTCEPGTGSQRRCVRASSGATANAR
jgi:hypothetical protein